MTSHKITIACAAAACLVSSIGIAAEIPLASKLEFEPRVHPAKPLQRPKPTAHPLATPAATEAPSTAALSTSGFGTKSAFTASSVPSPDSATLSPPVTLNYSGGSPVLLVNDNGTNKGVESLINNSKNPGSALFGQTNGLGAGVTGNNTGTNGPGGKFSITNASSSEPSVFATNDGKGYALLAFQSGSGDAAIVGQNTGSDASGTGIEGLGGEYGVEGFGSYAGIYGNSQSYGVFGYSQYGTGVSAQSEDGFGLYAVSVAGDGAYVASSSGTGLYAYSETYTAVDAETNSYTAGTAAVYANNIGSGAAVIAHSGSGYGITSVSETGNGIMGQSTNNNGVIGEDFGTGNGVYGYSNKGFAGYFAGKVGATSYVTLSDKNDKTNIHPIDSTAILNKVSTLPVSEWVFKSDPTKNHVGPMAQDFHAAFGLDGDDDKHINLTDIAGVSLAAIKELSNEMKEKDAQMRMKDTQIAELKQQLAIQAQSVAQMRAMTDAVAARMQAFEQQQRQLGVAPQTVSLRKESGVSRE